MADVRAEPDIPPPSLLVVLPVFNEQDSIAGVVDEWMLELQKWLDDFLLLAIDDGSRDLTLAKLQDCRARHGGRMEIRSRENRGHGASCLEGYREAVARGVPWVFQIDSDGQCDPRFFGRIWQKRENRDVIYGTRVWRDDGLFRMTATWLLKAVLLVREGVYCTDPNSPYRLMRTRILAGRLDAIESVHLANVALAVVLRRDPRVRHAAAAIRFRKRSGGASSVKPDQFGGKALQLVEQLKTLRR